MPTYRATLLATAAGQDIRNVIHVTGPGGAQDTADDLRSAWAARIVPQLHTSYVFQGAELVNIANDDAAVFAAAPANSVGTRTGDPAPSWVCASVRIQSSRRGRSGQGRFGLGPLAEDVCIGNSLTSAILPVLNTAVANFTADLASSGGDSPMVLAVVSYEVKGVKRPVPLVTLATGTSVNPLLGSRLSRHPNR